MSFSSISPAFPSDAAATAADLTTLVAALGDDIAAVDYGIIEAGVDHPTQPRFQIKVTAHTSPLSSSSTTSLSSAVVAAASTTESLPARAAAAKAAKIILADYAAITRVAAALRAYGFEQLVDICGVDYSDLQVASTSPASSPPFLTSAPVKRRFTIVYNFLSLSHNQRLMVLIEVCSPEEMPPSLTQIYPSAGWYEREIWDMYGVAFVGHNDLRRLLTEYSFEGHPLRKDFPLSGHTEVCYDQAAQRVVHRPVSLTQGYRDFDFASEWRGPAYRLPGDEKAGI